MAVRNAWDLNLGSHCSWEQARIEASIAASLSIYGAHIFTRARRRWRRLDLRAVFGRTFAFGVVQIQIETNAA